MIIVGGRAGVPTGCKSCDHTLGLNSLNMVHVNTSEVIMRLHTTLLAILCSLISFTAIAADRFFGFNETTSTVFTGVYLAPEGTAAWGPNEVQNDKDKVWDPGERLTIKGISRGKFSLKVVARSGHVCVKHGLDLTKDLTFDIRDQDLLDCGNGHGS